ncbi:MAG: ATP-binding protein [Nitrospirota bacterium]
MKPKSAYLLSADVKSYKVVHFRLPKDRLPDEGTVQYHILDKNSELVKFLKNRNDIIIKEELPGIVNQDRADIIAEELSPFKGEVVVPIFIDSRLALLLILGEKLSGDIFSDEDINLLNTIANQSAIAIKNAALYEEKIHSERLASTGMMAATLAHEIKNPLASIKVFTQLIPEKYYDKEFRETFSKIVSGEIQRIDKLVTELLDFSKQPPIAISNVTASNLLDDTLELFKGQFEENSIKIIKDYRDNCDIAGDPQRLKQALINIIINSYQAMNYGGVLNVTIAHEGDYVNISVNDNGVGIPEDDLERIFDPFFTTKQRGAGLGLAISKKIVEDHGGKIMVTSRRSEGTTFVLSLPSFKEINSGVIDGAYSASERQR